MKGLLKFSIKRPLQTGFILALSLLAFQLPAQEKELPPAGGAPKSFKLTDTHNFTLDNGLSVTLIQYGSTPKVTLRLITDTGNVDDGAKDAVSDLSYHLLTEGTSTRSAKEIAEAAANMGGQVQSSVGINAGFLQLDVLSDYVGDAANLLADLAINSKFTDEDRSRTVNNFVRDLTVQKSTPGNQATSAFYGSVFAGHPYAKIFADEKVVQSLTLQDLQSFVQKNLVAKRSHLFIAGKFDQQKAEAAVKAAFASMPAGETRQISAPTKANTAELIFIPRPNAPQSTLQFGLAVVDASHEDFVGLRVMNTLLGGSFASRITSNIRENKGYTYSPNSAVNSRVKAATWQQQADVTAEATGPALAEIIKEIKRLQTEAPSEQELTGFKNYISGIYVLQNSARGSIINELWFLKSHGLPLSRLENYVQLVNAMTPAQISALAAKYLTLDKMTLVVVGDESVKAQLSAVPELKAVYKL
jgi:predicted Zn-dependent peptidase